MTAVALTLKTYGGGLAAHIGRLAVLLFHGSARIRQVARCLRR